MRYNTQQDKRNKVEEIVANIPVGTKFVEYFAGFKGRHEVSRGIVIGHTKSGNIKLERNTGSVMKTKYHFQKVDKHCNFYVAGSNRNFVEFV